MMIRGYSTVIVAIVAILAILAHIVSGSVPAAVVNDMAPIRGAGVAMSTNAANDASMSDPPSLHPENCDSLPIGAYAVPGDVDDGLVEASVGSTATRSMAENTIPVAPSSGRSAADTTMVSSTPIDVSAIVRSAAQQAGAVAFAAAYAATYVATHAAAGAAAGVISGAVTGALNGVGITITSQPSAKARPGDAHLRGEPGNTGAGKTT